MSGPSVAAMPAATNTHLLMHEFELVEPRTMDEALRELSEADAVPMAGGTDLLVQMKLERRHPLRVVSLGQVAGLDRIDAREGLVLGAAARIETIAADPLVRAHYTALAEACSAFSSVAIMVMGTIGGNLCNASPASDSAPPLLAFDATVELVSARDSRRVRLDEFFLGPGRTVLRSDVLLRSVHLPPRPPNSGSAFVKVARVEADISKVSAAVSLTRVGDRVAECRIALGSVAPTPRRAYVAEQSLVGEQLTDATLAQVAELVRSAIEPISDQRSTAAYRRHVAGVLVGDALRTAWARAEGGAVE
jgi:CO/xanthine dehydrogenase FAD-binding subunit